MTFTNLTPGIKNLTDNEKKAILSGEMDIHRDIIIKTDDDTRTALLLKGLIVYNTPDTDRLSGKGKVIYSLLPKQS